MNPGPILLCGAHTVVLCCDGDFNNLLEKEQYIGIFPFIVDYRFLIVLKMFGKCRKCAHNINKNQHIMYGFHGSLVDSVSFPSGGARVQA
jgi:hypothetical protein